MALTDPASEGSTPLDALRRAPVVRVGRRFLPVAATALPPVPDGPGVVALPVAPGTPVHAMQSGRVAAADGSIGEVDLRTADDIRLLYRRLLPASVTLATGDTVESGDVIGIVAPGSGRRLAALELGVQLSDGSWEPVSTWLVGAPDPLELYVTPPPAAVPGGRRPRRAAPARPAPVTALRRAPRAGEPARDDLPEASQPPGPDAPQPDEPTQHETEPPQDAPVPTTPAPEGSSAEKNGPRASKLTSRRHKVRARPGGPARPPEATPEPATDPSKDLTTSTAGMGDPPRSGSDAPATAGQVDTDPTPDRPSTTTADRTEAQPAATAAGASPSQRGAEPAEADRDQPEVTTSGRPAVDVEAQDGGEIPEHVVSITVPSGDTPPAPTDDIRTKADTDQDADPETGTSGGTDRIARASRLTGRRRPRRSGT